MHGPIKAVLLASALVFAARAQAPALRAGVSVQMAVTNHAVPAPDADQADAQIVAVTASGKAYLDVTPVRPSDLAAKLKAGRVVYVKADSRTKYAEVYEVLGALRQAGVPAPVLLTAQKDPQDAAYPVPPKGLEVRLAPAAGAAAVEVHIRAAGSATYGDVVRVIDACRGAGAGVLLASPEATSK